MTVKLVSEARKGAGGHFREGGGMGTTVQVKCLLRNGVLLLFSEFIRLPGSFRFCGQNSCLPELSVYGQILPVAFGCPVVVVVA